MNNDIFDSGNMIEIQGAVATEQQTNVYLYQKLNETMVTLKAFIKHQNAWNTDGTTRLDNLETASNALQAATDTLEQQFIALNQAFIQLSTDTNSTLNLYNESINSLNINVIALQTSDQEQWNAINALQSAVDVDLINSLIAGYSDVIDDANAYTDQQIALVNQRITDEVTALTQSIASNSESISKTIQALTALQNTVIDLQGEVVALEDFKDYITNKEIPAINDQLVYQESQIVDLDKRVADNDIDIDSLDKRTSSLEERMNYEESATQDFDKRIKDNDADIASIQKVNKKQQREIEDLAVVNAGQTNAVIEIKKENAEINEHLDEVDKEIRELHIQNDKNFINIEDYKKNTAENTQDIQDLTKAVGLLSTNDKTQDDSIADLQARMTSNELLDGKQNERLDALEAATPTEDKEKEQDNRLTALEDHDATQDERISFLEDSDSLAETAIIKMESDIENNANAIKAAEYNLLTVAEKDSEQDERLSALEESASAGNDDEEQNTRLDALESSDTEQNTRIDNVESNESLQNDAITSLQTSDGNQNIRLDNIEKQVNYDYSELITTNGDTTHTYNLPNSGLDGGEFVVSYAGNHADNSLSVSVISPPGCFSLITDTNNTVTRLEGDGTIKNSVTIPITDVGLVKVELYSVNQDVIYPHTLISSQTPNTVRHNVLIKTEMLLSDIPVSGNYTPNV